MPTWVTIVVFVLASLIQSIGSILYNNKAIKTGIPILVIAYILQAICLGFAPGSLLLPLIESISFSRVLPVPHHKHTKPGSNQ